VNGVVESGGDGVSGIAGEVARCDREIAEVERLPSAGNRDVQGLCPLSDWSAELRILEGQKMPPGRNPAAEGESCVASIRP
jgi:hypothetical protein